MNVEESHIAGARSNIMTRRALEGIAHIGARKRLLSRADGASMTQ